MESASSYEFPPFDGKYSKFEDYPTHLVKQLPTNADTNLVFIVHNTATDQLKQDGHAWGRADKSSKSFFGNIPGKQRAIKFKCSIQNCPAVKFVDMVYDYDMSRVYYDHNHQHERPHNTNGDKTKLPQNSLAKKDNEKIIEKLMNSNLNEPNVIIDEIDEEDVLANTIKGPKKRKSKEEGGVPRHKKKTYIDDSDDEISRNFIPNITSTPMPQKDLNRKRTQIAGVFHVNTYKPTHHKPPLDDTISEPLHPVSAISKNSKLKEVLTSKTEDRSKLIKENEDMNLKIQQTADNISMLKNEKHLLSNELLGQMKTFRELKANNLELRNDLQIKSDEIESLKIRNVKLKQQLNEKEQEKQIVTLDEQIFVLQNLIEEKKKRKEDSNDIRVLEESLQACSAKKKHAQTTKSSNVNIEKVSRNLLQSFENPSHQNQSETNKNSTLHDQDLSRNPDQLCSSPDPELITTETVVHAENVSSVPTITSPTAESDGITFNSKMVDRNQTELSSFLPDKQLFLTETVLNAPKVISVPKVKSNTAGSEIESIPSNLSSSEPPDQHVKTIESVKCFNINHSVQLSNPSVSSAIPEGVDGNVIPPVPSDFNDTLLQSETTHSQPIQQSFGDQFELDSSITFLKPTSRNNDTNLDVFDHIANTADKDMYKGDLALSFKVRDDYWKNCDIIYGFIPHGHTGKAVFQMELGEKKKVTEIQELDDGRNWGKKKLAIKSFDGCNDHKRFYQDCNGFFECPNETCSARKLFSKPSQTFRKVNKLDTKVPIKCSSCDSDMMYVECLDKTIKDKNGNSPKARRYLDFDLCHGKLIVKYVGSHTCNVQRKVLPMDVEYVKKYFQENPGSTAARFKDFAIANAIHSGKDIEEVSLQYADLNKIRQIMIKEKKLVDPDGTGIGYLKGFSESLGAKIKDSNLLTVIEDPVMFIVSSDERMKVAALMSDQSYDTYESVSIDFCESQFKEYSIMEVTTYSGEMRQLVPMFQVIVKKPGENADNVCKALKKIDEMLQSHSNTKFEPKQWTTDNSGALENGIIRAKGIQNKPFLASDKLHDHNNINRVVNTLPKNLQLKIKEEIFKMINGTVPQVCENIYECLYNRSKSLQDQTFLRSLVFNYRKRHKFWFCYREVQDNNATSEQVNRVMTRHGKNEALIPGVTRMLRVAIADKAKFQLAAESIMLNKGPTVNDRKVRVERAMVKNLPEIISSIQEEVNSQGVPENDLLLKEKALDDFKPKSSDTHRSDKKRRIPRDKKPEKFYKQLELRKVQKSLKFKNLIVIAIEKTASDVTVTFKSSLELDNTVNVTRDVILCTCSDHDANYFCAEIVQLFKLLNLESLLQKKKFTVEEFALIKERSEQLRVSPIVEIQWQLERFKRKVVCTSCKKNVTAGTLVGKWKKKAYHSNRICLPREVANIKANILTKITDEENDFLRKNGVKV